jgi:5'-deoxynucleotidase YfbR-like HD superfamily hydrolase
VKYKSKTLLKELEKIGTLLLKEGLELSFKTNKHISNNIISFFNDYEHNKYTNIENQIVKFSDQLEAFLYSISELQM